MLKALSKRRALLRLQYPACLKAAPTSVVAGQTTRHHHLQQSLFSSWSFPAPPSPPTDDEISKHGIPLLRQAVSHGDRPFLTEYPEFQDPDNPIVTYSTVVRKAVAVAKMLRQLPNGNATSTSRFVAQSLLPGSDYVACQWGIFAAGKASVPLAISQKVPELEHVLQDCNPTAILVSPKTPNYKQVLEAAANLKMVNRIIFVEDEITSLVTNSNSPNDIDPNELLEDVGVRLGDMCLLLYTSGTTGKPKGVVIRHGSLYHQVTDLVAAWEWTNQDIALHMLPLHHVHGVVNLLSCAAYVGGQLRFQPFNAIQLWKEWSNHDQHLHPISKPNVLMAVPTIYAKLLEVADQQELEKDVIAKAVESTLKPMRLHVSGSAALPVSVLERWKSLTGHTLLERYGMTEFAMALSNPYRIDVDRGAERYPGHVGLPLPSVSVRLVDNDTSPPVVIDSPNTPGSLQVKGPTVFSEYWNRPDATNEAFTSDGYFDTGDVAEYNDKLNSYRILGRASVDILKVGGHKVSAIEIERELLEHPNLLEVVIVGIPDDVWGQRVGLIARSSSKVENKAREQQLTLEHIQEWCESRLAKYKIPTRLLLVDEIPKNAMGKVNKKQLVQLFQSPSSDS